jgi:phosphoglycolate phosphatase
MFENFGKKVPEEDEIRRNFTLPYMKFWNRYFPDMSLGEQQALYKKFIHQAGEAELYPNVKETVEYLKERGCEIFVLSSDPISKLGPEVQKSGLSDKVEKVVGDIHDKGKALESLVGDFKLNRDTTYYMGDTSGDVEAGKFAKIKTIGITWGFQHRKVLAESHPDFLIDDIVEIKKIL